VIPALVLAGGTTAPEFAAAAGVPATPGSRALAEIHGRPMVEYVVQALRAAARIDSVLLAAPAGFPAVPGVVAQLAADGTLTENIAQGLARVPGADTVLLVTADLPFLTPAAVDDFVDRAGRLAADCCYAAIPLEACERRFPGTRRTTVRVAGRRLTGGNVVLQRAAAFPRQAAAIAEAYRRRKNPFYLARLIGPASVVKLALGRLTQADIERGASRVMHADCRILITEYAELGTDVDKPADLDLARRYLAAPDPR
jgi:GTP:adenosylcobinamide-phosphate guanylyltransferase